MDTFHKSSKQINNKSKSKLKEKNAFHCIKHLRDHFLLFLQCSLKIDNFKTTKFFLEYQKIDHLYILLKSLKL